MMLTETLLFVIHYLLVIMTVFLASPADVAKLQQNEIKSKKRLDMRFSRKPSSHSKKVISQRPLFDMKRAREMGNFLL